MILPQGLDGGHLHRLDFDHELGLVVADDDHGLGLVGGDVDHRPTRVTATEHARHTIVGPTGQPLLIERLAADLVELIFDLDIRVQAVEMTVEKPTALRFARSVGVTIYRQREEG